MPRYNPLLKLEDQAETSSCLTGYDRSNRLFALEFSINHCLPIKDYISVDKELLKFPTTKIILRRYRKKTADTVHTPNLHKPIIVLLFDSFDSTCEGFNLHITKSSYRQDLYKLNKGCQLVSIYSEIKKNEFCTIGNVLKAIEEFKKLMRIPHGDDALNYAFKFCIELSIFKTSSSSQRIEQFTSCMFKYVFDDNGFSVITEEVCSEDYYK